MSCAGRTTLTIAVALTWTTPAARAITYTFTKITDSGGGPFQDDGFSPPLINNAGQVLFAATNSGGITTWYRVSGSAFAPIAADGGNISSFIGQASLNNLGVALCTVQFANGQIAAVTGNGGQPTTLYDSSNTDFVQTADGINDAGEIVFFGSVGGVQGAYRGNGGVPTRIVASPSAASGSINNAGQVAYTDSVTGPPSLNGVFRGNGLMTATIADSSGPLDSFNGFPTVNASGQVGFRAVLDNGSSAVLVGDGTTLTTIADTNGPYHSFVVVGFNDAGQVAFQASKDSPSVGYGIYTGPDPVADKVIAFADVLDGSTVEDVSLNRRCLNNSGQIAFLAMLSDLRGIYVATPDTNGCISPLDGDMNADQLTDGRDIQPFVRAVLAGSSNPADVCHGDFNGDGVCNGQDVGGFLARLLGP